MPMRLAPAISVSLSNPAHLLHLKGVRLRPQNPDEQHHPVVVDIRARHEEALGNVTALR